MAGRNNPRFVDKESGWVERRFRSVEQRLEDLDEGKLSAVEGSAITVTDLLTNPSGVVEYIDDDATTATADDTNVTFTLTYTPIAGSLKVFKNGLRLKATDFSRVGNVVTIPPSSTVIIRTDDEFTAWYVRDTTTTEPDAPPPSYFDAGMALSPVGFWNLDGDYTDDSGNAITLTAGSGNAFVASIIPSEPSGQAADMSANLSWAYSGTPVAAVDAIAGTLSFVAMGHYVDGSVDGHLIGQAAPSGGGDHHFRIKYLPVTEEVLVEWFDGSTRRHTLSATGTFDRDVLWGISADGTNVTLYIDGVAADATAQLGAPASQAGGHYVALGTDGATNNRWRGTLDGALLYGTALSADDMFTLAQAAGVA